MAGGGCEKSGGTESERPVRLDMTAMIDVIFLLLIFFMLGTKFREVEGKTETKQAVEKVVTGGTPPPPAPPALVLYVKEDGKVFLQGQEVPRAELSNALSKFKTPAEPERQRLKILSDKRTKFNDLQFVLDACTHNQITNISMEYKK
jgi:biopolymer transport protein ExbD